MKKQVSSKQSMKPFLKWAGGKRWFVTGCDDSFPTKFRTYFEPFVGGGAMFFHLSPSDAVLSDKNVDLIRTYRALRDDWTKVRRKLTDHQRFHSKEHFYKVRSSKPWSESGAAARFIYLNRTCWNGLYRVNQKGEFNVPKGTKDSVLLPEDQFDRIAEILSSVELLADDFGPIIARAGKGDLVYVDPPYTVRHNNNNFLKYNERIFSWSDQVRLAKTLFAARERGAHIVICNADHNCIRYLYKGFGTMRRVSRHSILAADPNNRRKTTELVITNVLRNN